jgi:hypothetical protein
LNKTFQIISLIQNVENLPKIAPNGLISPRNDGDQLVGQLGFEVVAKSHQCESKGTTDQSQQVFVIEDFL